RRGLLRRNDHRGGRLARRRWLGGRGADGRAAGRQDDRDDRQREDGSERMSHWFDVLRWRHLSWAASGSIVGGGRAGAIGHVSRADLRQWGVNSSTKLKECRRRATAPL